MPKEITLNQGDLVTLLRGAKRAHTEFERLHGPHPAWEEWYASWMMTHHQSEANIFDYLNRVRTF